VTSADDLQELSSDLVVHAARLVRAVRRASNQPAGLRVLSLLDEYGAMGITQLADVDRSSQPSMSGTVNDLLERGWVTKKPHPDDARSSLVGLSRSGRATLARFRRQNGRAVAGRLAAHGRHRAEDLAAAVAVLRDVLEHDPNDPEKGTL
jgi:DNA-binding MarR family transcriptional regulator